MNINLYIDRLILEGIELSPSQRTLLQATIESELSRLLTVNGIPENLEGGGNILRLPTSINVKKNMNPRQMGQEIAQSIYRDMKPSV
ncbi:MAG: hypothetical protein AB4372_32800 [Xenococcus sp. (in: cyanobacteria)]|nr:hypothetical protein [Xenococcaceae cyanobacterium MO_167.B52]